MNEFIQENLPWLLTTIAMLGMTYGIMKTNLKNVSADIKRLESKQDKYNNMQERLVINEQSVKSAHHRVDAYENKCNYHQSEINKRFDKISSEIREDLGEIKKVINNMTTEMLRKE